MTNILTTLFVNTVIFSALFGIMLLIRRLMSGKLSIFLKYALWLVVIVKLAIPFGFESDLSPLAWLKVSAFQAVAAHPAAAPSQLPNAGVAGDHSNSQTANLPNTTQLQINGLTPVSAESNATKGPEFWLLIAWEAGAAFSGALLLYSLWKLRRRIKASEREVPRYILRIFEQCKEQTGVRRKVAVTMQQAVEVPAITGIIRPLLILPTDILEMNDTQIRHVCLHELAHLKNGDLIVMLVMNILSTLYWFNPLVWICFNMIRRDMECVCDQNVIRALGQDGRKDYAGTVLQICSAGCSRLRAAVSMNDGRCNMEKRIRNMYGKNSSGKKAKAIIAVAAACMIAAGVLTACQPTPTTPAVIGKIDQEQKMEQSAPPQGNDLSAPGQVSENFKNADGKMTVNVNAPIDLPNASKFPVVSVSPAKFTQDQADTIIKVLMQGKSLSAVNKQLSKSQIEKSIIEDKARLATARDDQTKADMQSEIDNLQKMLQTAPDTVSPQQSSGKLEADPKTPGYLQMTATADLGKTQPAYLSVTTSDDGKASAVLFRNTGYGTGIVTALNGQPRGVKISANDAQAIAEKAVADVGAGLQPTARGICTMLTGDKGVETTAPENEPQAYIFLFAREVNGIPTTYTGQDCSTSPSSNEEDETFIVPWRYESISVIVDDTGILEFRWNSPYQVLKNKTDNAKLLTFDQIDQLYHKMLPDKYANILDKSSGNTGCTFNISRITLGMTRIAEKDNPNEYELVPVWDFFGNYQIENPNKSEKTAEGDIIKSEQDNFSNSLLTINAIDGSIIDRGLGY